MRRRAACTGWGRCRMWEALRRRWSWQGADAVTAIKPDGREIFYDIVNIEPTKIKPSGDTHVESEDSRSRQPESFMETSGGTVTGAESTDASRLPEVSSQSIAQESSENKENDGALKKNIRFQLAAPVEVDSQKDLVAVHNLTEQNLREALGVVSSAGENLAVASVDLRMVLPVLSAQGAAESMGQSVEKGHSAGWVCA